MEHKTLALEKGISGTALKRMACVSMLIDHFGAAFLLQLVNAAQRAGQVAQYERLYEIYQILRAVGRLAFPIYCFLLVEGFVHTHSAKRYGLRLLLFALVSEVPFDLAFFHTPLYWRHQNVYWTLLFGLLAMQCLKNYSASVVSTKLLALGGFAACAAAAELSQTDYGAVGVLLIGMLYLLRSDKQRQMLCGALMMLWEITAPLAFVPLWFYNGTRGRCAKWEALAFYLFYPAHILLLYFAAKLLLMQ